MIETTLKKFRKSLGGDVLRGGVTGRVDYLCHNGEPGMGDFEVNSSEVYDIGCWKGTKTATKN